jgi:uncharacterized HAD superfamily protein
MPKPENRETIAVDIDDVLVPHVKDLITWHNRQYGTQMTLQQYHSKDPKDWGAKTIEEAIKRVQKFFITRDFTEAKPTDEASKALRALSQNYNLIVITSRDNIIEDTTKRWLDQNFPELFQETHFTARFNLGGDSRLKSSVALAAKAKYLIDDALDNAEEAAKAGIRVLLFGNYPWNQIEELPDGITRVNDWQAVLEYFDEKG